MGDFLDYLSGVFMNSLIQVAAERDVLNDIIGRLERIPNNADKIKFAEQLLSEEDLIPNPQNLRRPKSNQLAKQYREEGNKYFSTCQFVDALKCYNKSLCFAEKDSENVGLAYANRSAVYCELGLYSRALNNIEKALEHNYPQKSISKLKEREEKCKRKLQEGEIELSDMSNGVEFFKLSHEPNPRIPFIVDCLKLKSNVQFGRHIITEKNLKPGDIVAIDEPFSKCLAFGNYQFCANCLNDNCFDLLPCIDCTSTMFCSESCHAAAFKTFHEYECPIVDQLVDSEKLATRTIFEALALFDGDIEKLMSATTHAPNVTVFDFDLSGNDEQNKRISMWKAVNSLATNESLLEKMDLLQCYYETAKMTYLLFKSTKLGSLLKTKRTRDIYRELLLKFILSSKINMAAISCCDLTSMENELNCGKGFFPFVTLINHSCAPNIMDFSYNSKHCLVVCRPIKAGEQLFFGYGDNHHMLKDCITRREHLRSDFMFHCSCEACEGHYPLINNMTPIVTNSDVWTPLLEDAPKLPALDMETAHKRLGECCAIINVFDQHYPCFEVSIMQKLLSLCLFILKQSPLQISIMKQNGSMEGMSALFKLVEAAKQFIATQQA